MFFLVVVDSIFQPIVYVYNFFFFVEVGNIIDYFAYVKLSKFIYEDEGNYFKFEIIQLSGENFEEFPNICLRFMTHFYGWRMMFRGNSLLKLAKLTFDAFFT